MRAFITVAAARHRRRPGVRRRLRPHLPGVRRRDRTACCGRTRLNDVSSSSPIAFSVQGKQYIAMVTGQGGFHAASYAILVPELRSPPDRGAMLRVFALP